MDKKGLLYWNNGGKQWYQIVKKNFSNGHGGELSFEQLVFLAKAWNKNKTKVKAFLDATKYLTKKELKELMKVK